MKRHSWAVAGLLLALTGLLAGQAGRPAVAGDNKPGGDGAMKKDPVADEVRRIALAYDLAAYARREQENPNARANALALITAAGILRSVRTTEGKEKATVEKGTDEGGTPVSLKAESERLLKEAREMAKDSPDLLALVDETGKVKTRGALGGPRSYYHRPGVGTVINRVVRFRPGAPASVSVAGNGRNSLTLTVTGPAGHYSTWTGRNPSLSWVPRNQGPFTIAVRNNGPGAVGYTLYHN